MRGDAVVVCFGSRGCGVSAMRERMQHENAGGNAILWGFGADFRFLVDGLWETLERGLCVWRVEVGQIFPLDAKVCDIRCLSVW